MITDSISEMRPQEPPIDLGLKIGLERVLKGEQINFQSGQWNISNLNSVTMMDLMYKKGDKIPALYGFSILKSSERGIQLINYHREAQKGTGTESLRSLEEVLVKVARDTKQDITLVFPKFSQEDTASWLKKNGYREETQEDGETYFIKEIKVKKPTL